MRMILILISFLVLQATAAWAGEDRYDAGAAIECMAKTIYFEARGEPEPGKIAVALVIMNRINDGRYADTVCGVVYQKNRGAPGCQFTWACRKHPKIVSSDVYKESRDIAEAVLMGKITEDPSRGAVMFNNVPFSGMRSHVKIGHHWFYLQTKGKLASN
jgi:spore germination cell wall hydrolase CwlJ-like protein